VSQKDADGFEGDDQRAIFRTGYAGHGLEMSLGGKDALPAADDDPAARDQTQAGYYANGVIEGMAQSVELTLEHLRDVFEMPQVKGTFCREAQLAIPVHAMQMLDHLAQIDRLISQNRRQSIR
jgi:hypothetical protein